jgi:uncharacterized protein (TIGR04222 family)
MINPLELTGPNFLIFYMLLGTLVLALMYLLRRLSESGAVPRVDYSDPYLIAYLRGGELETMRVAAVSLIDRGFLILSNRRLELVNDRAIDLVRRPVEAAVLRRAQATNDLMLFFDSRTIRRTTVEYKETLQRLRLLPDAHIYRVRMLILAAALAVLIGFALASAVTAAMRGRYNIFYLILLAAFFCGVAIKYYNPLRTALGDALLTDLRTLFQSLKNRASMIRAGGATGEAVLLMAVFGINALPGATFPAAREFDDRRRSNRTSCGGGHGCHSCHSSCSSSCSSASCGGGGGSGCGGGGGCGGGS